MAAWRQRGVVPDSDDEGSGESQGGLRHNVLEGPSTAAGGGKECGQSEQLLSLPSPKAVSDTLGDLIPEDIVDFSTPSSPLTEPERSPSPPPLANQHFPWYRSAHPLTLPSSQRSDENGHDQPSELAENGTFDEDALFAAAGARSLRARKEKQLHPYMFDKAQHQRQFRERGMRPIRVEPAATEAETQEAASSMVEDDSDHSHGAQHRPSPELGDDFLAIRPSFENHHRARGTSTDSEEELPGLSTLLRPSAFGVVYQGAKRRKIYQKARDFHLSPTADTTPKHVLDDETFDLPPSPTSTSRDLQRRETPRIVSRSFRMPRGLTPEALPTPQVSSEAHGALRHGTVEITPDPSYESARSRRSMNRRVPSRAITVDSSTESSDEAPEAEGVTSRLQRERKRIKGVLPASWLKIDLRAQQKQASPKHKHLRQLSPSPVRTLPQKGVAKKVAAASRMAQSPHQANYIAISDDESETSSSQIPVFEPEMRQLKLAFPRQSEGRAQSDAVDEDRMEVDWVDPMFAGGSRLPDARRRRKRQPRITESFMTGQGEGDSALRERRDVHKRTKDRHRSTHHNPRSKKRKPDYRTPSPRLSIIDAPFESASKEEDMPQFIRLARRRAQRLPDYGRHSPTHKQIRLTTAEETTQAVEALQAWRQGIIEPRKAGTRTPHVAIVADSPAKDSFEKLSGGNNLERIARLPLQELNRNVQKRLPEALRSDSTKQRRRTTAASAFTQRRSQQTCPQPYHLSSSEEGMSVMNVQSRADPAPEAEHSGSHRQQLSRVRIRPVLYRSAQLESLEGDLGFRHRAAFMKHRMHCLTEGIVRSDRHLGSRMQLDRFLNDSTTPAVDEMDNVEEQITELYKEYAVANGENLAHRPRKRHAQRVDVEAREYRQPSEPLPELEQTLEAEGSLTTGASLRGLLPFGARYATDFDMLPLPLGTYFHETSFIGSGEFAASLTFADRDLDQITGHIRVQVDGETLEWGAWTEGVATGLSRIPGALLTMIQDSDFGNGHSKDAETLALILANVTYLLHSVVRYFTRCLAFLDPVDRLQCVTVMNRLTQDLTETIAAYASEQGASREVIIRSLQYVLVLARQTLSLCNHPLVLSENEERSLKLLLRAANAIARHLFPSCLDGLRSFYEANHYASKREAGIRDTDTPICTIVILRHAIGAVEGQGSPFWDVTTGALSVDTASMDSVAAFDSSWYDLFSVLPALEIDVNGVVRPGSRLQQTEEDWAVPRRLIERLFALYPATSLIQGSTINDYVRATLTRCWHLVSHWGWWRCETILGTIYDYFARQGLAPLRNEEYRGSPAFLESLSERPSLEVQPEDRSFHIFLKMLVCGLSGMHKHRSYTDKKIGAIAWRFMPNHGRTHRKDAGLRQEDLDALRNHHDLIATLYYAVPPGHRLRTALVQGLVDHAVSHKEACRLNIRAWANLASFQASTDENIDRLADFGAWFREMLITIIGQYRLARNEAEQEVAVAQAQGALPPPNAVIEDIIARNQRQIAAVLVELLAGLKRALNSARDSPRARCLLDGSEFWQVFQMFDPSTRRLYAVLQEALEVTNIALDMQHAGSQPMSDESQDYGDPIELPGLPASQIRQPFDDQNMVDLLYEPVGRLVSDVFGADASTDDDLSTKIVDTWVRLCGDQVANGHRTWLSFFLGYDSSAWSQLRDTAQTQKYTPYFLSCIVRHVAGDAVGESILAYWIQCLVEREARLKFQHVLTNALLDQHADNPLLTNLPFAKTEHARYAISLQDLRDRRLATISSVLANMHGSIDKTIKEASRSIQETRRPYANILKQLMQAMKSNYQDLQASRSSEVADTRAQGAYVEFVQQVVSFLQQYTADICPVDRFFTDSVAFPLPITDPFYVVGRLRSYIPKLIESRKQKELAVFVQSVSERAALDGQKQYLVDQLVSAVSNVVECGDPASPSLRSVLCTAVFPAYIEAALSTAWSWIVAMPMIELCSRIMEGLLYVVNLENAQSVGAIASLIDMLLKSTGRPIRTALAAPELLSKLEVQTVLIALLDMAKSCMTCVQLLEGTQQNVGSCASNLVEIFEGADDIERCLGGREASERHDSLINGTITQSPWPDTLDFVRNQVTRSLNDQWYAHDGQYYLRRGSQSLEIIVTLADDTRSALLEAMNDYRRSYGRIFHASNMWDNDSRIACYFEDDMIV